jgi:hypothetical protein
MVRETRQTSYHAGTCELQAVDHTRHAKKRTEHGSYPVLCLILLPTGYPVEIKPYCSGGSATEAPAPAAL